MALWRDPLDDLIEDLERAVPADTGSSPWPMPAEENAHLVDLQIVASALMYRHTEAELNANQQYQEALRRYEAFCAKYGRI
jgi:hypothetical protein